MICTKVSIDDEQRIVVDAETNLYLRQGFIVQRIVFPQEEYSVMETIDSTLQIRIMENADTLMTQIQDKFLVSPHITSGARPILRGDRIVLITHGRKSAIGFNVSLIAYLWGLIAKLNQTHPIHIIYMACYGRGQKGRTVDLPNSAIGTLATLLYQFYIARQIPVPNVTVKGYDCTITAIGPELPRMRDIRSPIAFSAKSTRARIRYDGVNFEGVRPEDSESEIEDLFTPEPFVGATLPVQGALQRDATIPAGSYIITDTQARAAYSTLLTLLLREPSPDPNMFFTSGARDRPDISCYIIEQNATSGEVRRHPIHAIDEVGIRAEFNAYIAQRVREGAIDIVD